MTYKHLSCDDRLWKSTCNEIYSLPSLQENLENLIIMSVSGGGGTRLIPNMKSLWPLWWVMWKYFLKCKMCMTCDSEDLKPLFIHSLKKYSLSAKHVSRTVLDTGMLLSAAPLTHLW